MPGPRLAFALWIAVLCLVPYWVGVTVGGVYVTATSVVGALVVASLHSSRRTGLGAVDLVMVVIVAVYAVGMAVGGATVATGFVLVAHWGVGYLLGRMIASAAGLEFVYGVVAVAFTVVAVLAIVEFLLGRNVFQSLRVGNAAYANWSEGQLRGGYLRSEGAFGHSIALGCCLAISIPLIVASPFREWIRAAMVVVVLSGTVVTFSRTAMACAALSLVLTVLFLRGALPVRTRVLLVAGGTVVALAIAPFVLDIFVEAGSEATGSSAYRGDLLSLLPTMSIIGLSSAAYRSAAGDFYFGAFQSIDSALILLGLSHGLVTLALVVVLLAAAGWYVVSGRATAPTIALVAQIPALATVALITQYALFFWVLVGLAVSSQLLRAASPTASGGPAGAAADHGGGTDARTRGRTGVPRHDVAPVLSTRRDGVRADRR